MSDGWIKLHRQIEDNAFWLSEPFTRGQAWVDLLLMANHGHRTLYVRGNKVDIERGQVGRSLVSLAQRWQWSKGKVLAFLSELQGTGMIDRRKSNVLAILTVKNYDKYQSTEPQNEPQIELQNDRRMTAERPQNDPNKKDKNDKKEKNILSSTKKGPRPSVEKIMLAMHECFGTLDRTETENRRYAWLLIQRAMKGPPESSEDRAADLCCALITAARKSDWWGEHITCVQDIYRNARKIAASLREQESTKAVFIS